MTLDKSSFLNLSFPVYKVVDRYNYFWENLYNTSTGGVLSKCWEFFFTGVFGPSRSLSCPREAGWAPGEPHQPSSPPQGRSTWGRRRAHAVSPPTPASLSAQVPLHFPPLPPVRGLVLGSRCIALHGGREKVLLVSVSHIENRNKSICFQGCCEILTFRIIQLTTN